MALSNALCARYFTSHSLFYFISFQSTLSSWILCWAGSWFKKVPESYFSKLYCENILRTKNIIVGKRVFHRILNALHLYLAWRPCRKQHTWKRTRCSSSHCRAARHPGWWKAHLPTSDHSGNSESSARGNAGPHKRAPGSRTIREQHGIVGHFINTSQNLQLQYQNFWFLVTTGAERRAGLVWVKLTHVMSA